MILPSLSFKSLRNRALTSVLTVLSIALSVTLLLSVERIRKSAQEGFTSAISQTDLIVGARSGPVQLLLFTVFNVGNPTHNISYKAYEKLKDHPAVAWTIPYSLGDGHKGFRVVGTNEDFFKYYHYRGNHQVEIEKGRVFRGLFDVVLGAEVARSLGYKLGDNVVVAHGVTHGHGVQHHDDKPFQVVGILSPTGTALDRAVYITLEGMEAMHVDWHDGAAPVAGKETPAYELSRENLKVDDITAFFVGAKNRVETLKLQREINEFAEEPLLAIIPGATLAELWDGLSYVEGSLKAISWMVVVVGLTSMLIALLTTLQERRREIAILRALGASVQQVTGLLIFESGLLTLIGIVVGLGFSFGAIGLVAPWIEREFGLYLTGGGFSFVEIMYLIVTLVAGVLIGVIPAMIAMRNALKDGLTPKV
jgi:ABC-type transport system, involved in lipoprotein release, permease component